MSQHVLTIKIFDLGVNELADVSAITLTRQLQKTANSPTESVFTVTMPANSSLLTAIAADGYPVLNTGNRKLVVWEDADPATQDPIFHGRIFVPERDSDEDTRVVTVTAYQPSIELGYDADSRAGRYVRDGSATTVGDPSFLTPHFTATPSGQTGISGPDLIKQILTYSQGDPSTNPVQGEGPLPIALTGAFDLDVPPALDVNPVDSADWPVMVGDFIQQLIATDAVDVGYRPLRPGTGLNLSGVADDYIMVEMTSKSKLGTDRSATVHFDHLTGSFNARGARLIDDFATQCDRLWYELGPRIDAQHWRGDITPHGAANTDLLPAMDAAAAIYGGPNTKKGYNAWLRVFDSVGDENSSRPLYEALYRAEIQLRLKPRRLVYVTPNPDSSAIFEPPHDFDIFDLVQIKTGADFGVVLDEAQRVYGYTKTWDSEGVASVSELQTSAEVTVG